MRKLFTLLLAVAASVGTLFAWDYERVQIGDLYYNLNATNQTAEVTYKSYTNNEYNKGWGITTANIPASVEYNSVTYSVTSIGRSAFSRCTGLTSVTIPNSVTSIGDYAFYNCTGLTSVTIPNSVTSIGGYAFYNCTGLTSPVYNAHVFAFMPTSYSGAYTIPDGIESIAGGAFSGCTGLTSVTIGNSVTSIGYQAFYGCSGLTSVTIPNSVTSIGDYAFRYCSSLTSIEIPEGITYISIVNCFNGCTNLRSIGLPSTFVINGDPFNVSSSDGGIRIDTLRLAANMLPYGETQTNDYHKDDRYTLAGYYHYSSYYQISEHDKARVVFQNIKYIEAPYWFLDVPERYWSYCPNKIEKIVINRGELNDNICGVLARQSQTLKTVDISGVTNLPDRAFVDFYNLQSIVLPANIEKIGYKALAECVKLKSIDIPASVVEIDDRAFEDCRSLQTITFGGKQPAAVLGKSFAPAATTSNLKRIGNWAFYNAHELQNLEIPEGVTEIGDGAFYGCTYLKNLNLPASVQSIGDNGFAFCSKLQKMVVHAVTPPDIDYKTFEEVSRQTPVYVPDESVDEYENHPLWKEFFIQGISYMPQGLEEISSSLQGGDRGRLILHDGQIFILRGEKIYTVTGQEVK